LDSFETEGVLEGEALLKKDKNAWNIITLGVDDSQHVHVKTTKEGKETWLKLTEFRSHKNYAIV
jgi:hypothetical protein